MDVNQVRFGNYTIGNSQAKFSKKEEAKEKGVEQQPQANNMPKVDAEDFFSAMNIAGLQNKAQINSAKKKEINPADYLSEERIRDIEAMMGNFDSGVNKVAESIEQEFPGLFKPEAKMALAAKVFADQE